MKLPKIIFKVNGWCSILVNTLFLKAGLKIRQGHIDEVPGVGCRRPVGS